MVAILIIAAVAVTVYLAQTPEGMPKEIRIGWYNPMTGPAALDSTYNRKAAILAVEEINAKGGILGKPVVLYYGDDMSRPDIGAAAVERLITVDKVVAITGGWHSSVFLSVVEVTTKYGIPHIEIGATVSIVDKVAADPDKYRYFFKSTPNSTAYGLGWPMFLKDMEEKGKVTWPTKKYVFIAEDTDWSAAIWSILEGKMEDEGWTCVGKEKFPFGEFDFYPQLTKIKGLKPDIMISVFSNIASAGSFAKQMRELDVRSLHFCTYGASAPEFPNLAGIEAANYTAWNNFIGTVGPKAEEFTEKFEERWGHPPSITCCMMYDGMYVLCEAIEKAGSTDARAITDAIWKTDYAGAQGRIVFDPSHEVRVAPGYTTPVVGAWYNGTNYYLYPRVEHEFILPPWWPPT